MIETIKEGRATREPGRMSDLFSYAAKQEENNWHNKLIWGDNLLVLASLMEEYAGKVDLIYIDPPFATGADFSFTAPIGESGAEIFKEQSAIEVKAYRDTWGRGLGSYLQMLTDRLTLIRDLLSDNGSLYLHLDDHVSHYVKTVADEVFGKDSFINEIVWQRTNAHNMKMRYYPRVHDVILFYSKSSSYTWNPPFGEFSPEQLKRYRPDEEGRLFTGQNLTVSSKSQTRRDTWRGVTPPPGRSWASSIEERDRLWSEGLILVKADGAPRLDGYKVYLDEKLGRKVSSLWTDISRVGNTSGERLDYSTQKPETLLERIITTSTREGALVADFFCGSGTTAAVAEKLGRRWIACDLGRYAIHTTRKRLLDIPDSKPFQVLNLGKYERAYWQGITFGETPTEPNQVAIAAYIAFILELYKAQGLAGSHIHGKKGRALIHVGAVDAPVTINQVNEALAECATLGQKELHILGWEWEMGMNDPIIKHAQAEYGISLRLLNIPREVMEKRAVECGDIRFFDLAYLEAEVKTGKEKRSIQVELKNFVIPDTDLIPDEVREKITKWSDYIDYWAVDWDFRHDTFMNQWQTYRTRSQRKLDLVSDSHTYKEPGAYSNHSGLLDAIAVMFGRKIGKLTATPQPVKLTGNDYLLSETEPFLWRRMISHADRTIFNVVPCYNDLEVGFASFLNGCDDIDRFAALAEWFTKFHVQYLSLTGSIRLYYPDFVAVQTTQNGDVHWILETKGREFEETTSKDFHMARWCEDVSLESGESWRYLKVLQPVFEDFIRRGDYRRFEALVGWNSRQTGLFSE